MPALNSKHILIISLAVLFSCSAYYAVSISSIEASERRTERMRSEQAVSDLHSRLKTIDDQQKAAAEKKYADYIANLTPDSVVAPDPNRAIVLHRIETKKSVVFLTIDDGEHLIKPALDYILAEKLNPTLFLTDRFVELDVDFFKGYTAAGVLTENHTMTHANLVKLSFADQKKEICDTSDRYTVLFGRRPRLFRPPYGNFNNDTLTATKQCGIDYLIHWAALVDSGTVRYQTGNVLKPGDIVLMHFRPRMMDDLKAFRDAANSQGLTPANLDDWLTQKP